MTKKAIYEQVVQLTGELAHTKVAERIFSAAKEGNVGKTQMIIDVFPIYYPELNKKIVSFGEEFNKLVGDSKEDNAKFKEIREQCEFLIHGLAESNIIGKIAETAEAGDPTKLQEVISNFKQEYTDFSKGIVEFQKEYNEYYDSHQTGHEGAIFGIETDEENSVFVFDTNVIDALSFYVLNLLGDIDELYFFTDWEEGVEKFIEAIKDSTNEAFADFVCNYTIKDWVGKGEEYQSIGEILVAALADEFEEHEDEEEKTE